MRATSQSPAEGQLKDVDRVTAFWTDLGHAPRSVRAYRQWTLQILATAQVSDYRQLSADRVAELALAFARKHRHGSPSRTRQRWLSAFRAFAWGLQRLGKTVGSPQLSKKSCPDDPVMLAFFDYGRKLGWSSLTVHVHRRYLILLRRFLARSQAPWPVPRLIDLDRFLHWGKQRWSKSTLSSAAGTLRAWLRFLFVTGHTGHDLAESVALPPFIAFPRPARALPWATVRKLGRGIDRSTPIGQRVSCWAKRAGVEAPFLGTHLFRHSFATHHLERGLPLKVIGDLLGHRSPRTTGVYVRTALERLRPLALPVPT